MDYNVEFLNFQVGLFTPYHFWAFSIRFIGMKEKSKSCAETFTLKILLINQKNSDKEQNPKPETGKFFYFKNLFLERNEPFVVSWKYFYYSDSSVTWIYCQGDLTPVYFSLCRLREKHLPSLTVSDESYR